MCVRISKTKGSVEVVFQAIVGEEKAMAEIGVGDWGCVSNALLLGASTASLVCLKNTFAMSACGRG